MSADYEELVEHFSPDRFARVNDPRFTIHPMAHDLGGVIARAVFEGKRDGQQRYIAAEAPPRHGKSMLCTHKTPPWKIRWHPMDNIGIATYESDFAGTWGRKIRDDIEAYGGQYGVRVRSDSRSVKDFNLEYEKDGKWQKGGNVFCTGVGGPLTGRGFHLLIIDDPIKNSDEAASPTIREKHWQWWQSTASTRLEPGAVVLFMMTRWHEDDLLGRLLTQAEEDPDAPQWIHCRYPAICESEDDRLGRAVGEPLWPERYSLKTLNEIRKRSGEYYWAAMFQQRPAPLEGGMFKREWFKFALNRSPDHVVRVRAWDFAAGTKKKNDWTVGTLIAWSPTSPDHVRIEDVVRFKGEANDVQEEVLSTAQEDGTGVVIVIPQDPAQAGKDQFERYKRLLADYFVEKGNQGGDKVIRAQGLSAKAQAGRLELVRAPWNEAFIDELCVFDKGRWDDQVDSASDALAELSRRRPRMPLVFREDENAERRHHTAKLIRDVTPRRGRERSNFREVFKRW